MSGEKRTKTSEEILQIVKVEKETNRTPSPANAGNKRSGKIKTAHYIIRRQFLTLKEGSDADDDDMKKSTCLTTFSLNINLYDNVSM